jgi:hypothetical protein
MIRGVVLSEMYGHQQFQRRATYLFRGFITLDCSTFPGNQSCPSLLFDWIESVAPVRLCDGFVARRLGSATTKRSGDSNEIEPVILVGY